MVLTTHILLPTQHIGLISGQFEKGWNNLGKVPNQLKFILQLHGEYIPGKPGYY